MMTISIIKSLVSLGSFVGVNIRMHDNKELRLRYYVVAQAQVPVEVRVLGTSNQANAGLCKGSEVLSMSFCFTVEVRLNFTILHNKYCRRNKRVRLSFFRAKHVYTIRVLEFLISGRGN